MAGFLNSKETTKIIRQKDSHPLYQKYLKQLAQKGLIYSCSCSRKTILSRQNKKVMKSIMTANAEQIVSMKKDSKHSLKNKK